MNKQELIRATATKSGKTLHDTERIIEALTNVIKETVSQGEEVKIVNFGKFELRNRKGRKLHNPIANNNYYVPDKKAIKFTPGKDFKETANKGDL